MTGDMCDLGGGGKVSSDTSESEKIYRSRIEFFERPIISNFPYDYELVSFMDPNEFTIQIKDPFTTEFRDRLQSLLKVYVDDLHVKGKGSGEVDAAWVYEGMPVLVNTGPEGGSVDASSLRRAEVVSNVHEDNTVGVQFADEGGLHTFSLDKLLGITVDILRIPRLGIHCQLAKVVSENGVTWGESSNYEGDFIGKVSQKVTFMDYYPLTRTYEVTLAVDKINVALKYFITAKGHPTHLEHNSRIVAGRTTYPVYNYEGWMGLKVPAFGIRVFYDHEDPMTKCVLQLLPEVVNEIQDWIADHVEKLSDEMKRAPFDKKPGTMCLARYGGQEEYFRAIILDVVDGSEDMYVVDYVDYKETKIVNGSELLKLPEDIPAYPEGSVICQFAQFTDCDIEQLRSIIENKDVFAVVECCDAGMIGNDVMVSLSIPEPEPGDYTGADKSILEILGIEDQVDDPSVKELLQLVDPVKDRMAELFLKPRFPDRNVCYPGAMITVVGDGSDSIWIQFKKDVDTAGRVAAELAQFYANGGCDAKSKAAFASNMKVGMFVALLSDGEEGKIWYRGKVLEIDGSKLLVQFVDYGDNGWTESAEVYPLHIYFAKDHLLAVEFGLK